MLRQISVSTTLLLLAALMLGVPTEGWVSEPLTVSSPDGNITLTFELKSKPRPYLPGERAYYRVSYKGVPVLADSPLGLDFLGMRPLDLDFEILRTNRNSDHGFWENAFG